MGQQITALKAVCDDPEGGEGGGENHGKGVTRTSSHFPHTAAKFGMGSVLNSVKCKSIGAEFSAHIDKELMNACHCPIVDSPLRATLKRLFGVFFCAQTLDFTGVLEVFGR